MGTMNMTRLEKTKESLRELVDRLDNAKWSAEECLANLNAESIGQAVDHMNDLVEEMPTAHAIHEVYYEIHVVQEEMMQQQQRMEAKTVMMNLVDPDVAETIVEMAQQ